MSAPVSAIPGAAADEAAGVIRRYEERLARDPTSLVFAPLADAYRKAGRTREAISLCRAGLERFPHYTTARLILAKAHVEEGGADDALHELDTILAANPRDAEAHRLAAEIQLRAGHVEEARRRLEALLDVEPDDREARYLLDLVTGNGRVPDASPLARVLTDDLFATRTFAGVCLEQGLADEAARICVRILTREPEDARARTLMGQALRARMQKRRG
jgi:predicted Zn-dependent protease